MLFSLCVHVCVLVKFCFSPFVIMSALDVCAMLSFSLVWATVLPTMEHGSGFVFVCIYRLPWAVVAEDVLITPPQCRATHS